MTSDARKRQAERISHADHDFDPSCGEHPVGACLVVIDPNSPADQERLLDRLHNSGAFRGVVSRDIALDCIGDALRSLIAPPKPPKPEEPTGLGAVVEDDRGDLWVRDKTTTTRRHWKRARGEDGGRRHLYADITAVRKLSDGVQP